ncbi:MAG: DUF1778 domain-containing protein [Minisyncoccia bacterium]
MPKLSVERKARKPAKRHRLEARITDEQRQLFQRAADLQGRSLSDFVISTVHEKAMQTIESMEIIRLNASESLKMAEAIFNPREPSPHLRKAAKRYLATIEAK